MNHQQHIIYLICFTACASEIEHIKSPADFEQYQAFVMTTPPIFINELKAKAYSKDVAINEAPNPDDDSGSFVHPIFVHELDQYREHIYRFGSYMQRVIRKLNNKTH